MLISDEEEVLRILTDLGIPIQALQRALAAGKAGRDLCTDNDAPFIPGTEAWRYVLRTLRDELLPRGWKKSDPGNYSLVTSETQKLNIVVATGDSYEPYGERLVSRDVQRSCERARSDTSVSDVRFCDTNYR